MKYGTTKSGMARQNPVGGNLRGSKADTARTTSGKVQSLKASGKISAKIDAVETTVKEKTNTWNKSSKESGKIESELYKMMVEAAAIDERQEQKEALSRTCFISFERDVAKSLCSCRDTQGMCFDWVCTWSAADGASGSNGSQSPVSEDMWRFGRLGQGRRVGVRK